MNSVKPHSSLINFNNIEWNWFKLIEVCLSLIYLICNQFLNFYFFKSFEKTRNNFKNVSIWKNGMYM